MGEWRPINGWEDINEPIGTVVDILLADDAVILKWPLGDTKKIYIDSHGYDCLFVRVGEQYSGNFSYTAEVAYRIHDDGSEAKTREARMEQFRNIAKRKDMLIDEQFPVRERVK